MPQTERIIGFRITNLLGSRDAALLFIRHYAFLSLERAEAIVDSDVNLNVYATGITQDLLLAQQFDAEPVLLRTGLNVISTTSSILRLPYDDGTTLTLEATAIAVVDEQYLEKWQEYVRIGVIRFVPFAGFEADYKSADFSARDWKV